MPAKQETEVQYLGQEDPLEEMTAHFRILAWEIPWTEELGRLQSMWSLRVGHDLVIKKQQQQQQKQSDIIKLLKITTEEFSLVDLNVFPHLYHQFLIYSPSHSTLIMINNVSYFFSHEKDLHDKLFKTICTTYQGK